MTRYEIKTFLNSTSKLFSFLIVLGLIVGCQGQVQDSPRTQPTQNLLPQETPLARNVFPPLVQAVIPADDSQISIKQPFTIYFSKPMDKKSVEASIKFSPDISGGFDWIDDHIVRFVPDQELLLGQTLSLRINQDAQDFDGLNMPEDFQASFRIASPLRVGFQYPANGQTNVDPGIDSIILSFNQPVTISDNGQQAAFRLEPETPGEGKWIGESIYVFVPSSGLIGGIDYQVVINRQLISQYQTVFEIGTASEWKFSTIKPEIASFSPSQDQEIPLDQEFTLHFNQPMQTESVASNFRFQDVAGSPVTGRFSWNENETEMRFIPENLLERGVTYQLDLFPGSLVQGGGSLDQKIELNYTTVREFSFEQTIPEEGMPIDLYGENSEVRIIFSSAISPDQDFKEKVRVFPEVENLSINLGDPQDRLIIDANFQPGIEYQVLIASDLRDRWEGSLEDSFIFRFTVSPPAPEIQFLSKQYEQTIVLDSGSEVLPVQAINISNAIIGVTPLSFTDYLSVLSGDEPEPYLSGEIRFEQTLNPLVNTFRRVDLRLRQNNAPLNPGIYLYRIYVEGLDPITRFVLINQYQIISKRSPEQLFVWVTDPNSDLLDEEVSLQVLNQEREMLYQESLNQHGEVVIEPFITSDSQDPLWILVNQEDRFALINTKWNTGLLAEDFNLDYRENGLTPLGYIDTDKQIYKPGDEIRFFGLIKERQDTDFQLSIDRTIVLRNMTPNLNGEMIEISSANIQLSEYGSFNGVISVPLQLPDGIYQLEVFSTSSINRSILVENSDISSNLQMEVRFDQENYEKDHMLSAVVYASYKNGISAGGLPIIWKLNTVALHEGSEDSYYENITDFSGLTEKTVKTGTGQIKSDGTLKLDFGQIRQFVPDELDYPLRVKLEVGILQAGYEILMGTDHMSVHDDRYIIEINSDKFFDNPGEEIEFLISTYNLERNLIGAVDMELQLQKAVRENGVSSGDVIWTDLYQARIRTSGAGTAAFSTIPGTPGAYRIQVRAGETQVQNYYWVGGTGLVSFPLNKINQLPVIIDKDLYSIGEKIQLFIPNPFGEEINALVTVEREKVLWSQAISFNKSHALLEIPVGENFLPNAYISVIVNGVSTGRTVMGYRAIPLDIKEKTLFLDVDFEQVDQEDENSLLVNVLASDNTGKPVPAHLFALLVDKSSRNFHFEKEIIGVFWDDLPLQVITAGSLDNVPNPQDSGQKTALETLSSFRAHEFIQIAYLELEESGDGNLLLSLPEDAKGLELLIIAFEEGLNLGVERTEFPDFKTASVNMIAPDFVNQGDKFIHSVEITNLLEFAQTFRVSLLSNFLQLESSETQEITIGVGETRKVDFDLIAYQAGIAQIDIQIKNPADDQWLYNHNMEVFPFPVVETKKMSGQVEQPGDYYRYFSFRQVDDYDSINFQFSAFSDLSTLLESAVKESSYQDTYTIQQISWALLLNLHINDLIQSMALDADVLQQQINFNIQQYSNGLILTQNIDGGWGETIESPSDPVTTTYALWALHKADSSGIFFPEQVIRDARNFTLASIIPLEMVVNSWQLDQLAFQYFVLTDMGETGIDPGQLFDQDLVLSPASKALLALTIDNIWPGDARSRELLRQLENDLFSLVNAGIISSSAGISDTIFPNSVVNTAIGVYVFSFLDPANDILPDAVHFLIANQNDVGKWGNLNESTWSAGALSAYLRGTGLRTGDFSAEFSFNNVPIANLESNSTVFNSPINTTFILDQMPEEQTNQLHIVRTNGEGTLYYFTEINFSQNPEEIVKVNNKFSVEKYIMVSEDSEMHSNCVLGLCQQDVQLDARITEPVPVILMVSIPLESSEVFISEPLPPGVQLVELAGNPQNDFSKQFFPLIEHSSQFLQLIEGNGQNLTWYAKRIPAGTYVLRYFILPQTAGDFGLAPTSAWQRYFPETLSRSAGMHLIVSDD